MTINLIEPTNEQLKPRITVIGVGGAGCNAVNNMIEAHLEGVEFLVANTDAQSLANSSTDRKVQLGAKLTKGLGAGAKPEIGRQAADESLSNVLDQLEGTHMLFVTAGMGGGTGTGAAPVIAEAAREKGILTVGVVTKPFEYEGIRRTKIAEQGIKDLTDSVDTLIIIPNQNLFRIANKDTTFTEAFKMADEVLYNGVKGVTDLIVKQGRINLDFADIQTVMLEMGKAMMGTGEADGEDRAIKAAELAISNPLLDDTSISNAKGVIINISGGEDVKLYEIDEIAAHIKKQCKEDVNLIVGNTIENIEDGKIRVSLLASGISSQAAFQEDEIKNNENIFVKPRLVSNSESKELKSDNINQTKSKQGDLEDFLSKEINDALLKNNNQVFSSNQEESNKDFFIPQKEAIPNQDKTLATNPFKEADLLNANGKNNNNNNENSSLISRLSSNVKEKAMNVGSKAMSMVSEVAIKSLDNKSIKKEQLQNTTATDFTAKERVEPSFMGLDKGEDNTLNSLDKNSNSIQDSNYNNIPSFLKRNRD
ncbi:MAG: cell division protein FtsZ [Pelagibacterales bacterium]|nr:cell division protein FtsZ [Pelagibacterales bacterium]OUU62053.1 MAG: cell division protein FtsZ [Alphaproteobacteria bacterium TMED62]|tara:strand:+ start:5461 stop:7071 length:1611 start_codon:yes stop_codon:yes gene_type:complete